MSGHDPYSPNSSPSLLTSQGPGGRPRVRRLGRWLPLVLVGTCFVVVAGTAGLVISQMKKNATNVAATDQSASPSDAGPVLIGLPAQGAIPALRPYRPPAPVEPRRQPADPAAAASSAEAPPPSTKPRNDLADMDMREQWQAYYRHREEAKWRRYEAARASAQRGATEGWGAPQGGTQDQQPGTAAPGSAEARLASLQGGGDEASRRASQRPGAMYQGPSDAGRSWLAATAMPPISRFALMKGDNIACRLNQQLRSDAAGQFTATVIRPVKDGAGRTMIPWGATLVGTYDQNTDYAQDTLPAGFTDIIYPPVGDEGYRYSLALGSMPGTDAEGSAGFRDQVNRHTSRVLFSALVSGLAGGAGAAAGAMLGGAGSAGILATQATSGLGQAGQNLSGRGVNTASTIEIRRGYDCNLQLTSHIPFPGQWKDGIGWVSE